MAGLRITVDARQFSRFGDRLDAWAQDQLRFVQAASLTDTAKDAVRYLGDGLSSHFKVRNKSLRSAITYQPADKRSRPPYAIVGTREWAEFLTFQAVGGLKRAKGGRVAVPTGLVKRTASGRVRATQKPRTLRDAKGFLPHELEQRERIAVRRRTRDRRSIFFHLVRQARIPARWPFLEEVKETVAAKLPHHYIRRMREALKP